MIFHKRFLAHIYFNPNFRYKTFIRELTNIRMNILVKERVRYQIEIINTIVVTIVGGKKTTPSSLYLGGGRLRSTIVSSSVVYNFISCIQTPLE